MRTGTYTRPLGLRHGCSARCPTINKQIRLVLFPSCHRCCPVPTQSCRGLRVLQLDCWEETSSQCWLFTFLSGCVVGGCLLVCLFFFPLPQTQKFSPIQSASLAGKKKNPSLFSVARIALFLFTTVWFSVFPSSRNNTGVFFRLGRHFKDLAVLAAVHRTVSAA